MPTKESLAAPPGEKWCPDCRSYLSVSAFNRQTRNVDGLRDRCRKCDSAWRERWHLRTRYGLTLADYQEMNEAQGGVCKICKQPPTGGRTTYKLHVDHDHETGKIRGLLCFRCNATLGKMEDRVDLLEAMIDYLEENK